MCVIKIYLQSKEIGYYIMLISATDRRPCTHRKDYQDVGKRLIFFKLKITEVTWVEDIKAKCSPATLLHDELEECIQLMPLK